MAAAKGTTFVLPHEPLVGDVMVTCVAAGVTHKRQPADPVLFVMRVLRLPLRPALKASKPFCSDSITQQNQLLLPNAAASSRHHLSAGCWLSTNGWVVG